jgi:prepilin-type N-terminal cleavage/methylation domain-containing protein
MTRRRGFTLIEVLVALVVAVAAMTLLAQGFSIGARASVNSQFVTRAALLSQRVITDFETGQLPLTGNQSGTFDDEPDFTYETVSDPASTSTTGTVTGLTQLTVTIKWQERNTDRTFVVVRLMKDRPSTTTTTSGTATGSSSSSTTPPK